ncbi:MAG: sulfotransferase, partial [Bacteroidota bacterium]
MADFKIPPISTLAGTTIGNYIKVLGKGKVQKSYYLKVVLTFVVLLIAAPFHWWERLRFGLFPPKTDVKPPVFILGHWRSGTTFLHNVLCQDPRAGYVSTYHGCFPHNLASKLVFKTFMKVSMPDRRPADRVKLHVDFPQEDEFALGNLLHVSYYNFFYFPREYSTFYKEAVALQLNKKDLEDWQASYRSLIERALWNTNGSRAVVKNPVNTGRIRALLQLYPEAKFIYIYRNPITVFLSTFKFFDELFPTLWFQEVDRRFLEDMILDVFVRLMEDYEAQKDLIPEGNLVELKFEDFDGAPLATLENLYRELLQEDFEPCRAPMEQYIESQRSHRMNRYKIPKELLDRIEKEWGAYITAR